MDEEKFDRLLEKYQKGKLTARERRLLEQWLEQIGDRKSNFTWSPQEKQRLKENILSKITRDEVATKEISKPVIQLRSYTRWAAVILLLISFTAGMFYIVNFNEREQVTTWMNNGPSILKVSLPEGSIVWLKGNSTLSYKGTADEGERLVELTGEALFEVAKLPDRPFAVKCRETVTRVLGTSFNIDGRTDLVEVAVLTGRVTVSNETKTAELLPNQKAISSSELKMITIERFQPEAAQALTDGTEYMMRFSETLVSEVFDRLEEKFNVSISTRNERLKTCHLTADFTDQSLEVSLNAMAAILGFAYEIDEQTVTISGGGC